MSRPAGEARQTLERVTIDGIPVFWLPDGRRPMAALQFRVGRSDEAFAQMGITHLVEHLAFFQAGRRPYPVNGFVDNVRTVFHVAGSGSEISEFLQDIVAALQNLPLDRVVDEARILRTEALRQNASLWDQLAWYRYGAVGHGAVGLPEFGLNGIAPAAVAAWSRDWFTAGNAALWIAGPIPDGLRLALPPGPRRATRPADPIPGLELPAWTSNRIPGIAMGVVVPRESAPAMANRILTKRLETHLRYELGRSYEVSVAYQPLDAVEGQASIFASCLEEDAAKVRASFLATVDQLAHQGPTPEELAEDRASFVRHLADPDAGYSELDRATHSELIGHPQTTSDELLAEMDALSPHDVREALRAALDRAILMGPLQDPPDGLSARQWRQYPVWSASVVAGKVHDRTTRRFPWSPRTEHLVVGPEGVSWVGPGGQASTVRFADCIGMVIDEDGARWAHGRDGFRVRVHAPDWKGGASVVAALDAAVPADRVVRIPPS